MRLIGLLFIAASFISLAEAQDVVCSKKMKKVITIGEGDSFSFKTQKGAKYLAKTKCQVTYKKESTCPSIQFSCSEFDVISKKKSCKGGDTMMVIADGKNTKFCQTSSPDVTTSGNLKVVFKSNKKTQSTGAVCTVQCAGNSSPTTLPTTTLAATTATTLAATTGVGKNTQNYFVSLSGSDAANVPGSESSPWRTLNHAIQQLRLIRPNTPGEEDAASISIRGGVYYQSELVQLGRRDQHLTIQNYKEEEVALSGGIPLDLVWQKKGEILSGRFSGSCSEAYYGNYRLLPARSPNTEWGFNKNIAMKPFHKVTDLLVETETCRKNNTGFSQTCPDEDRNGFFFNDELSKDWEFLNQTEILIFHSWIAEYATVANISLDNGRKKVMFQEPLRHAAVGDWLKSGDLRFQVFNNLALLDMPGEYVCNVDGGEAIFSFIPPDNMDVNIPVMGNLEVILSLRKTNNITVSGIQFQHNSYHGKDFWNFGDGAVEVVASGDININNCQFAHTAMLGLFVRDAVNVIVQQNVFFDIGYHGVLVLGDKTTEDVMISNNYFDGCGISRFWQPVCIWIAGKRNISAVNNEVTNTANGGIMAKSGPHGSNYWSDNGVTEPTRDDYIHHVEFNYVHDFGQGILSDYGAIKTGSSSKCDGETLEHLQSNCHTYIHVYNNLVRDGKAYKVGANFLYSDATCSRNTFENNILIGSGSAALYHHCGVDNISKNNIIHRTTSNLQSHPMDKVWAGCAKTSGNFQTYSNFHNIYLLEDSQDLSFYKKFDMFDEESPDFYQNLYWSLNPMDVDSKMFPYGLTWYEWTQTGNDSNSKWTDPQLQDPSSGLYVLGKDSPAWDLGINQIELGNFGINKNVKLFYKK